jgi:dTDP-glucose 4,6-dehydratase/UDP-glucose 4-epimerase
VVSLKALAEELVALAKDASFELTPFPPERKAIDIGDYYGDHSLIAAELGWQPRIPLRTGLQRTLDYYRQHAAHYWE